METADRKMALVTGASSGIGEAFARRLARDGYAVVLVARRRMRLETLAAELRDQNEVEAEVLPADLTNPADVEWVERRICEMADLELLVNSAGFATFGDFAELPVERWLEMVHCHILASLRFCHAALPHMLKRQRGGIITVSSIGGLVPKAKDATYCATKAYLNMFTRCLQYELRGTGVHVQALCPGFVLSEFHDGAQYARFKIKERLPKFLWMTADEVVSLSLAAFPKDKAVFVPGFKNQLIVALSRSGLNDLLLRLMARSVKNKK
jgi:short-subunit dehydrogenase